jgi:hypothetical protein
VPGYLSVLCIEAETLHLGEQRHGLLRLEGLERQDMQLGHRFQSIKLGTCRTRAFGTIVAHVKLSLDGRWAFGTQDLFSVGEEMRILVYFRIAIV